jgi:hypothetical protein
MIKKMTAEERASAEIAATLRNEVIRNISEAVYRMRLEDECKGNVNRMLEKDGDGGIKLRNRAGSYDALTRAYAKAFGVTL